jgi:hypothetical protein
MVAGTLLGDIATPQKSHYRPPSAPAITIAEARILKLPSGRLFCEAGKEEVEEWLTKLALRVAGSTKMLDELLPEADLAEMTDRWFVLESLLGNQSNPLNEAGPVIKDYPQLLAVLSTYGMHLSSQRRADGRLELLGIRPGKPRRKRVYLGTERQLLAGALYESDVTHRIEAQGIGKP